MLEWLRRTLTRQIIGDLHETEARLSRRLQLVEQRLAETEQVLIRHGLQIARIDGRASVQRPSVPASDESVLSEGAKTGPKRIDG